MFIEGEPLLERRDTSAHAAAETPAGARSAVVSSADLRPIHDALAADTAPPRLSVELEERIESLCARGRAAGMRIEEILVQLKSAWRELPGTPRFEALSHRDTRLDRVVTALIEHYFDTSTPDSR